MEHNCTIDESFGRPALVVRARSPLETLPEALGRAFQAVAGHLAGLGEAPAGPPFCIYYNMDMADLEIAAGFTVARPLAGAGAVEALEFPRRAATCLHRGPYTELRATYGVLGQWVQAQGLSPSGAAYEFYLDDPVQTPAEALRTLIAFGLCED